MDALLGGLLFLHALLRKIPLNLETIHHFFFWQRLCGRRQFRRGGQLPQFIQKFIRGVIAYLGGGLRAQRGFHRRRQFIQELVSARHRRDAGIAGFEALRHVLKLVIDVSSLLKNEI